MDDLRIEAVDPQGDDALALLREAAIEARALFPELLESGAPWPTNEPTPDRGTYLLAYVEGQAIASGALRPIGSDAVEIRRMFVLRSFRNRGVAREMLDSLVREASRLGFVRMRLETGFRQTAAMRLYNSYGFVRIPPFGPYVGDATSVCYEMAVPPGADA